MKITTNDATLTSDDGRCFLHTLQCGVGVGVLTVAHLSATCLVALNPQRPRTVALLQFERREAMDEFLAQYPGHRVLWDSAELEVSP